MPTTVETLEVVPATPDDRSRCGASLTAAFVNDPLMRWMFPDAETYFAAVPQVMRHFGGSAFELGTASCTDDFAGTALWLAPDQTVDEEGLGGVMAEAVPPERLGDIFGLLELVGASHPEVDHWYLPCMGVDPCRQGLGYGSLLLSSTLAEIDRDGVAAYLESSNPRNVPLYERFGFQVVAEIQSGDSPTIYPMLRAATA